jgi:hypothetical protein
MASETIERFIATFEANRARFEAFCRSLSEEELARPVPDSHWQVRDFIAHLGTLDTVMTQQVEALATGQNETIAGVEGEFDVDAWNEVEVQSRRGWTVDELLDEAAANRKRFLAALGRLTDAHIEQTMHFTGDNKRDPADLPYKVFLGGLARHDPIHVADMVKALPDRAEDAEIKEWLNDSVVRWYQTAMAGPAKR